MASPTCPKSCLLCIRSRFKKFYMLSLRPTSGAGGPAIDAGCLYAKEKFAVRATISPQNRAPPRVIVALIWLH
jgi:hypothetical protein